MHPGAGLLVSYVQMARVVDARVRCLGRGLVQSQGNLCMIHRDELTTPDEASLTDTSMSS